MQAHFAKKVGQDYKIYTHAEMNAIIRCRSLDKAYRIDVFRYDADGKPVCAKPCVICMQAIRESGIKEVRYT
jgi:deoxycytidylate deaminase